MNHTEHLLTIIAEECSEVSQRVSKALRFGLHEVHEGQSFTNAERIGLEFEDLLGAYAMLQSAGVLPTPRKEKMLLKMDKIDRLLYHSKEMGTLT